MKKPPNKWQPEKKKTKEERDIINAMKIFARYNPPQEHDQMVNNLIKEKQIREIISQLKSFQKGGLTSLDQIQKFIELNRA